MSWLSFLDFLVEPTFIDRNRPPLNIKVTAKFTGWVVAVLAVLLVFLLLSGVPSMLRIGSPGYAGIFGVAIVGLALLVLAQLMALVGAWQMIRGTHSGRRLLIHAHVLIVVFSLVYNIGRASLGPFVLQLVLRVVLYYLTVISRFPDEAAAGTSEIQDGASSPR